MNIKYKIILLLLIFIKLSAFSNQIDLLITNNCKALYEQNDTLSYKYIKIGQTVQAKEKNLRRGYIKIIYNGKEMFIYSTNIIDHRNLNTVSGLWVTPENSNVLFDIDYNPLKGSKITKKGILESKKPIALYHSDTFNSEKYIFIYQSKNMYGWIKLNDVKIDTDKYYSITPNNNLQVSDNIEKELLSKTNYFIRDGIHLKIPSMKMILTDDFANRLHHKRYRAYSTYKDRFLIYSELIDIKHYYHLVDIKSNNKLFLNGIPQFNNDDKFSVANFKYRDNNVIEVSIVNFKNNQNLQKELSINIELDKSANSIESMWVDNNKLKIVLNFGNKEVKSFFFLYHNNYWECSDKTIILKQKI